MTFTINMDLLNQVREDTGTTVDPITEQIGYTAPTEDVTVDLFADTTLSSTPITDSLFDTTSSNDPWASVTQIGTNIESVDPTVMDNYDFTYNTRLTGFAQSELDAAKASGDKGLISLAEQLYGAAQAEDALTKTYGTDTGILTPDAFSPEYQQAAKNYNDYKYMLSVADRYSGIHNSPIFNAALTAATGGAWGVARGLFNTIDAAANGNWEDALKSGALTYVSSQLIDSNAALDAAKATGDAAAINAAQQQLSDAYNLSLATTGASALAEGDYRQAAVAGLQALGMTGDISTKLNEYGVTNETLNKIVTSGVSAAAAGDDPLMAMGTVAASEGFDWLANNVFKNPEAPAEDQSLVGEQFSTTINPVTGEVTPTQSNMTFTVTLEGSPNYVPQTDATVATDPVKVPTSVEAQPTTTLVKNPDGSFQETGAALGSTGVASNGYLYTLIEDPTTATGTAWALNEGQVMVYDNELYAYDGNTWVIADPDTIDLSFVDLNNFSYTDKFLSDLNNIEKPKYSVPQEPPVQDTSYDFEVVIPKEEPVVEPKQKQPTDGSTGGAGGGTGGAGGGTGGAGGGTGGAGGGTGGAGGGTGGANGGSKDGMLTGATGATGETPKADPTQTPEYKQMESDFKAATDAKGQLEKDLDATQGKLEELQQEYDNLLDKTSDEAKSLQEDIDALQLGKESIQDELDAANGSIQELEGKLADAQGTISGQQKTISSQQETISGQQETISGLEGDLKTAKDDLAAKQKEYDGLVDKTSAEAKELQGKIDAKAEEIKGLEGDLATAKGTIEDQKTTITGLEKDLKTAQGNRDAKQSELDTANENLKTAESNLQTAKDDLAKAKEDYTALENKSSEEAQALRDTIGEKTGKIAKLEEAVKEAQGATAAKQGELDTAKESIKTLEGSLAAEQEKVTTLEGKLQVAKEDYAALEQAGKDAVASAKADGEAAVKATQEAADAKLEETVATLEGEHKDALAAAEKAKEDAVAQATKEGEEAVAAAEKAGADAVAAAEKAMEEAVAAAQKEGVDAVEAATKAGLEALAAAKDQAAADAKAAKEAADKAVADAVAAGEKAVADANAAHEKAMADAKAEADAAVAKAIADGQAAVDKAVADGKAAAEAAKAEGYATGYGEGETAGYGTGYGEGETYGYGEGYGTGYGEGEGAGFGRGQGMMTTQQSFGSSKIPEFQGYMGGLSYRKLNPYQTQDLIYQPSVVNSLFGDYLK